MTSEDDAKKISELIADLQDQGKKIDDLMNRVNRKKEELNSILRSFREANASAHPEKARRELKEKAESFLNRGEDGARVSTGNFKLDSLLYGGLPPQCNIVLRGPPFSGKFLIANNFIAQSIRDGVPVIVLSADKDIGQMKAILSHIVDGVEESEKSGMLKFIDAYSRSIQAQVGSQYALQVDQGNISALIKSVDAVTSEIKGRHGTYRLLFTSLTTFITQMEEKIFLRFLQQFSQKRKAEGALSIYILEDGLFDDRIYEAVSYLMDGQIQLRKTFTESYLRVEGLGKARTREWVEMYPSEIDYDLGSFTLERVR